MIEKSAIYNYSMQVYYYMETILIDVRTEEEYAEYHASGAVNIPVEEISEGNLGLLEKIEKNTPLRLYCRSGARSERAREILQSYGFTDVVNLGGLASMVKE